MFLFSVAGFITLTSGEVDRSKLTTPHLRPPKNDNDIPPGQVIEPPVPPQLPSTPIESGNSSNPIPQQPEESIPLEKAPNPHPNGTKTRDSPPPNGIPLPIDGIGNGLPISTLPTSGIEIVKQVLSLKIQIVIQLLETIKSLATQLEGLLGQPNPPHSPSIIPPHILPENPVLDKLPPILAPQNIPVPRQNQTTKDIGTRSLDEPIVDDEASPPSSHPPGSHRHSPTTPPPPPSSVVKRDSGSNPENDGGSTLTFGSSPSSGIPSTGISPPLGTPPIGIPSQHSGIPPLGIPNSRIPQQPQPKTSPLTNNNGPQKGDLQKFITDIDNCIQNLKAFLKTLGYGPLDTKPVE